MARPEPKKHSPSTQHLKTNHVPKAAEDRHRGKRPTSERPPAPRVPPKRRER